MGKLARRWELGGLDVVAVVVMMPRCLGPGEKKQDASVKSVGFPVQLWQSGLVLSHDNVGLTKSWGPGFYTCM